VKPTAVALLMLAAMLGTAQRPAVRWEWLNGPLLSPATGVLAHQRHLVLLTPEASWMAADPGRTWFKAPPALASARHVAASQDAMFRDAGLRLERSEDLGRTWQACGALPLDPAAGRVAGSLAAHGRNVFAAVHGAGLFGSRDRCASWQPMTVPWDPAATVDVSFVRGDRLIVRAAARTFLSTDAGRAWRSLEAMIPEALTFAEYCGTGVLAGTARGVLVSLNGGLSWTATGLTSRWVPAVASARCGEMFAAVKDEGRWTYTTVQSLDAGATWTPSADGLPPHPIYSLASLPDGATYASGMAGLFRRAAQDLAWTQAGPPEMPVTAVLATPSRAVLASTANGLFSKAAEERRWKMLLLGHDAHLSEHVPVSSAGPLAVTADGGLLSGGRYGVLRSGDGGATWLSTGLTHQVHALASVKGGGETIAGTSAGVFRSTDAGRTWRPDAAGPAQSPVLSVAEAPDAIYAGARSGDVLRREANGSWTPLAPLPGPVHTLVVTQAGTVLAGTDFGCFRWRPGEAGWTAVPARGGTNIRQVRAMVRHNSGAVVAGTDGAGVFVSTDDGVTWSPANDGLSVARILSLSAGSDGTVYAGTSEGAFRGAM
jgi:photosystem II stability/assembly factor-like uncharacterized protein